MTEETKEIICKCGHSEMVHGSDGCLEVVHGDKVCRCGMVSEGILRAALASERAARILAEGKVVKLRKALENAVINLEPLYRNDAARWATMDVAQNYAESLTADYVRLLKETS